MGGGRTAAEDAEVVAPFKRGEPGVEVIVNRRAIDNGHRIRFEVMVQRL